MDLDAYFCKATFYVRPERTLLVSGVGRRVGAPGSLLWTGGWVMGCSSRDFDGVPPERVLDRLTVQFCTRENVQPVSSEVKAAWMRTWRAGG
jgi:hypothetical protein